MPPAAPIIAGAALSGIVGGITAGSVLTGIAITLGPTGLGVLIDGKVRQ